MSKRDMKVQREKGWKKQLGGNIVTEQEPKTHKKTTKQRVTQKGGQVKKRKKGRRKETRKGDKKGEREKQTDQLREERLKHTILIIIVITTDHEMRFQRTHHI